MDLYVWIGLVLAIPLLLFVIMLLLANLDAHFTKVEQGTTVFISAGDSLKEIIPNVGGYRLSEKSDFDGRRWLIKAKDDKEAIDALFENTLAGRIQKFLWVKFGIRFVSWVWPHTHIESFDIRSRKRLKEGADVAEDTSLKSRVVSSEADGHTKSTVVKNLLFLVPRPVYLDGVQLAGDNSRVNLLLLPVYRQVIPSLPVFYLKGDFFAPLDAALEAAVLDFAATHRVAVHKSKGLEGQFAADSYKPPQTKAEREKFAKTLEGTPNEGKTYEDLFESSPLTYAHWLKLSKAGGSPLEQHLRTINVSRGYYDQMKKEGGRVELVEYIEKLSNGAPKPIAGKVAKMIPSGIVPRFGFAMVSFRLIDWEPHSDTVELANSLLAKETERHRAEGVRAKAEGTRDQKKIEADGEQYALTKTAEGEADRFGRLTKALKEQGVSSDIAAGVVATQLRMENIRGSQLTTYVEGGRNASVMVPTPQQ